MSKRGIGPALLALLLLAAAAVVVAPVAWPCPIRLVLGIPCPTCGITRATRLVLHGDLAGATRMHPLVWLAVPVTLGFLAVEVRGYLTTRAWGASRRVRGADALMLLTASLLFALWIARWAGALGGPV
jgi:hypothetical protein